MATDFRACDVDLLLDEDYTPKKVWYCGGCKKWICESCWMDKRRVEAALEHWKRVAQGAARSVAAFFSQRLMGA